MQTIPFIDLFLQIPGQHNAGIDEDWNKNSTYDGSLQPVLSFGGVDEGEDQGQKIHTHQQHHANEGQNPFTFIVFHSSFSIEESFLS